MPAYGIGWSSRHFPMLLPSLQQRSSTSRSCILDSKLHARQRQEHFALICLRILPKIRTSDHFYGKCSTRAYNIQYLYLQVPPKLAQQSHFPPSFSAAIEHGSSFESQRRLAFPSKPFTAYASYNRASEQQYPGLSLLDTDGQSDSTNGSACGCRRTTARQKQHSSIIAPSSATNG